MSARIEPSSSSFKTENSVENSVETSIYQHQREQSSWMSFVEIIDSEQLQECAIFKLKEGGTKMPIFMCTILIMFQIGGIIYVSAPGVPLLYRLAVYCRAIIPVVCWMYIYLLKKHVHSDVITSEGKRIMQFGNSAIIMQSVFTILLLFSWVITRDDCDSDVCFDDFPDQFLPLGLVAPQIIGGIAMPMFFTCHDASASLLSVCITYSAILVAGVLCHLSIADIIFLGLMGIVMLFALGSYESNMLFTFTSCSKFESTLRAKVASDNKEYLMNIQTEEMRHMIGTCRGDSLHKIFFVYNLTSYESERY
jgi:hypothetical protein